MLPPVRSHGSYYRLQEKLRDKVCRGGEVPDFVGKTGAPGAIPTRDLSLRRRALYAAELREHGCEESYHVYPGDYDWYLIRDLTS